MISDNFCKTKIGKLFTAGNLKLFMGKQIEIVEPKITASAVKG